MKSRITIIFDNMEMSLLKNGCTPKHNIRTSQINDVVFFILFNFASMTCQVV